MEVILCIYTTTVTVADVHHYVEEAEISLYLKQHNQYNIMNVKIFMSAIFTITIMIIHIFVII